MANSHQEARAGNGQYIPTPETAERHRRAMELRTQGWTHQRIADELGFSHRSNVAHIITEAIAAITREPAADVLHFELERLDAELPRLARLEAAAHKVLEARHIVVNNGHVIKHPDTDEPMEDDAPVLQAIDRLIKIEDARRRNGERRAKLTGIEAAIKVDSTVHQVDAKDIELAELVREAQAKNAAEEARIKGGNASE